MIEVASDDLYQQSPHAILETFLLYQTTVGVKGLSARTLRALYNARTLMDGKFRADPVNREMFMRILQAPSGMTHAVRLMLSASEIENLYGNRLRSRMRNMFNVIAFSTNSKDKR